MKLVENHPALLIFDNFKAQCTKDLLTFLDDNNIHVVLIPAKCTDKLQPLDFSVNKASKDFLRSKFQNWYAQEVVDLRLSVVKPLGARWMISLYDYI